MPKDFKVLQSGSLKAEEFFKNSSYWQEWKRVSEEGIEMKFLRKLLNRQKRKKIKLLDIACGHGRVLKSLRNFRNLQLYGLDINKSAVRLAKKVAPEAKIRTGSIYRLPYPDKFFDIVIVIASFMHFEKPQNALAEITRVSKKWILFDLSTKRNISEYLRGLKIMSRSRVPEFRYNFEDIWNLLPKKSFKWKIQGVSLLSHKLLTKKVFKYYQIIDGVVPSFMLNKIGHSIIVIGERKN